MSKAMPDYYALLDVTSSSTPKDITKAYRVKALKLHPDKNPDNPNAAKLFAEILDAYNVLMDTGARAAYDSVVKSRVVQKRRHVEMDETRKRMREDLERREKVADDERMEREQAVSRFQAELSRMRAEADRRRREKEAADREAQVMSRRNEKSQQVPVAELDRTIKVKWDARQAIVDEKQLREQFIGFGEIAHIVSRKPGSALIQFETIVSAHAAITRKSNLAAATAFETTWATGSEPAAVKLLSTATRVERIAESKPDLSAKAPNSLLDYESMTLMRMRKLQHEKLEAGIREREAAQDK